MTDEVTVGQVLRDCMDVAMPSDALPLMLLECSFTDSTDSVYDWEDLRQAWMVYGHQADQTHGMTIDELIPEAIAEWEQVRDAGN